MAHARCSLHPKHTHISLDLESHPKQPQVQGKETSPSEGRPSDSHCLHLRPPP
ncbi:hypothetical protein Q9966_010767, partial [Columba livia]